jgi:hypothetical protein
VLDALQAAAGSAAIRARPFPDNRIILGFQGAQLLAVVQGRPTLAARRLGERLLAYH